MWRNRFLSNVWKVLMTLVMLFLLASAIKGFMLAAQAGSVVNVFLNMLTFMACGVLGGCIFAWFYLPGIIDWFFQMRPARGKPAPLVSPVEALIRRTRYEEALKRLEPMFETDPEVPTLWIMRFDLLRGPLGRPEEAMRTAEKYFIRPKRLRSDGNAKLLLRYAELSRELGRQDEAARLIAAEQRRLGTGYSKIERRQLASMLEVLRGDLSAKPEQPGE